MLLFAYTYTLPLHKKLWWGIVLFIFASTPICATTYYSRSNGVNWNVNSSWSVVAYGGAAAGAYPVAGDTVNIANGNTIYINVNSACSVINIGQGTSGILEYSNSGSYTLTVSGDLKINNGAKFWYNGNSTRNHSFVLGGNLTNNGTLDFVYDANDLVNTTFNGSTNSMVSGTGSWTLNNVTMNKSLVAAILEVQGQGFETAIAAFTSTKGTYIHNNAGSFTINSSSATDYTINLNVIFKIPQGTVTFSNSANRLNLEGALYVNGGNVYVGSTAGANGLRYTQNGSGIPYIEVSYGSLTVYGGISYATGAASDPFSFHIYGGTVLLNNGSTGTIVEPFLINDVANSSFVMTGGKIIIQAPNYAGTSIVDFGICGNNGSVNCTSGTVQFGNASTGNNKTFSFKPYANCVQPNFWITGPSGNSVTVAPFSGSTSNFKLLSLTIDNGKTFDVRSYGGANGDSKNMTLTFTPDDIYGLYSSGTFVARTGTVTFSSTNPQSIGGAASTSFYNLTINTSSYVTLTSPETVTHQLTMTSGKMMTDSVNLLTCTSPASANIGSATSYVDGPMIHTIATALSPVSKIYPIGKGSSYRPAVLTVTHLTSSSVTYKGEVINSSAAALGFSLPSTLSKVSYTRYWNFTRQNVLNFISSTMQLYYDTDDSVTNASGVRVANDNGLLGWLNAGGTGTANITGNITSTSILLFNTKFALGFPPSSLPVELMRFKARNTGDKVACEWTTASEINNNYFTVERSADGSHYDSILYTDGAGTSTAMLNYSAVDENPLNGDSYYRLRQTDYDGKSVVSKAVHIYRETFTSYRVFPNPSNENVMYINNNGADMDNVKVIVHNMMGQEVGAITSLSLNKKEVRLIIASDTLRETGAFVVSILSAGDSHREKVLINQH